MAAKPIEVYAAMLGIKQWLSYEPVGVVYSPVRRSEKH